MRIRSHNTIGLLLVAGMGLLQGCTSFNWNNWLNTAFAMDCRCPYHQKIARYQNHGSSFAVHTQSTALRTVTRRDSKPLGPVRQVQEAHDSDPLEPALQAYKEFDYLRVTTITSDVIARSRSAAEKGSAYILRGASQYLMNDLKLAKSDFAAAKRCGVGSPNNAVFSGDMIKVFNESK
jgi:hypothetical protein